jgi:hypothetical protein
MSFSGSALPHQERVLNEEKDESIKNLEKTAGITPASSGTHDHRAQSDIFRRVTEADGSFKRRPSAIRNFITQMGEFTPEKGKCNQHYTLGTSSFEVRPIPPLRIVRLP